MPHRDPETGQFVADDERAAAYSDLSRFRGTIGIEIPAADLSGGTTTHTELEDSDVAEIIDFSRFLSADEVFEVYSMFVSGWFAAHTTASGQGFAAMEQVVSREADIGFTEPPFHNTDDEFDVYDVRSGEEEVEEELYAWNAATASQVKDGSSSAAGAEYQRSNVDHVPVKGIAAVGPMFDQDDELYAPCIFYTDSISNFAVELFTRVDFLGMVHEG